ncbi:hypothetical protein X797_011758 [Metarhizium robertsii]|uniref:Uncharacterized protein n=1 Tax=Metarhizium robertsii TaxID=568076 RepID=A0A014N658_9HYPO|nr:hypothetical protein X797_011758 [Metarhizium robertsii]
MSDAVAPIDTILPCNIFSGDSWWTLISTAILNKSSLKVFGDAILIRTPAAESGVNVSQKSCIRDVMYEATAGLRLSTVPKSRNLEKFCGIVDPEGCLQLRGGPLTSVVSLRPETTVGSCGQKIDDDMASINGAWSL